MPAIADILGRNARNKQYLPLNPVVAKSFAGSKYATKLLLENKGIPVPKSYGLMTTNEDVDDFDWNALKKNFVIKPTNGSAGKGIVVFKRQLADGQRWVDVMGNKWSLDDIKFHCYDILEGQYGTWGGQHHIIIEERVITTPTIAKYCQVGAPDLRVIVYNSIPVMAMLRVPTLASEGRANLHQGALGMGVDLATGITTNAITGKGQEIKYLPGTKRKLNGIKIPNWKSALTIAVDAAKAAHLQFSGIDLLLSEDRGPLVVELNSSPGLSIQLANKAGLRRRLERVVDLPVQNTDHGVRIARSLFATMFVDKTISREGLQVVNPKENIIVYSDAKEKIETQALLHTGRFRSAISYTLAEDLGIIDADDLLWFQQEKKDSMAPVVQVKVKIKERDINTTMVVSKRLDKTQHKIEIGRKDLAGFLISTT